MTYTFRPLVPTAPRAWAWTPRDGFAWLDDRELAWRVVHGYLGLRDMEPRAAAAERAFLKRAHEEQEARTRGQGEAFPVNHHRRNPHVVHSRNRLDRRLGARPRVRGRVPGPPLTGEG